jgi:hypothetical protein
MKRPFSRIADVMEWQTWQPEVLLLFMSVGVRLPSSVLLGQYAKMWTERLLR